MDTELKIRISESIGEVSAILRQPVDARWLLVLAHGAGAGMRHAFLQNLSDELAAVGVGTLRYQFPYMEQRRGRPDPPAMLTATVRAVIAFAAEASPSLPLLAGGKSLGGRMTSHVFSEAIDPGRGSALDRIRGVVFYGFPLHPPGQPGIKRAAHLHHVHIPMLFLQGTRDTFANLTLLRPLAERLASRATLHLIDTADHSFHVLKRSGKTDPEVIRELAQTTAEWADSLTAERLQLDNTRPN